MLVRADTSAPTGLPVFLDDRMFRLIFFYYYQYKGWRKVMGKYFCYQLGKGSDRLCYTGCINDAHRYR